MSNRSLETSTTAPFWKLDTESIVIEPPIPYDPFRFDVRIGGSWDNDTGAFVGDIVGVAVGAPVGVPVGEPVGSGEGAPLVGKPVEGCAVGEPVGDTDGNSVGRSVGVLVGDLVGDFVGDGDGMLVGLRDGGSVGRSVGLNEGVAVGKGVKPSSVGCGEVVGVAVGVDDGAAVGPEEGSSVGPTVGGDEGSRVGNFEGDADVVGRKLGREVGLVEGAGVGDSVGRRVGFPDGASVVDGYGVGASDLSFGPVDSIMIVAASVGDELIVVVGIPVVLLGGDCAGWEVTVVEEVVLLPLPMFRSGSTMAVKDALETIPTMLLNDSTSSGFSSMKRAPLKSPGRKEPGRRKGKSMLLTRPIRMAFSSSIDKRFRR